MKDREIEYIFTADERETGRAGEIGNYRCKSTWAGDMVDVAVYPVFRKKSTVREARKRVTEEQVRKQNEKNAKRKLEQLVAANFGEGDLAITLTYEEWVEYDQAKKDVKNFLRKVRRYRKAKGMTDIKYIYAIEPHKSGCSHIHLLMSEMDRAVIEEMWGRGYANSKRLQPKRYGLIGIARYMAKDPQRSKRWVPSKNLEKPKTTVADKKISRAKAAEAAMAASADAAAIFEKLYPGYEIIKERPAGKADYVPSVVIKYSQYVDGVYIYARLQRVRRIIGEIGDKARAGAYAHGQARAVWSKA